MSRLRRGLAAVLLAAAVAGCSGGAAAPAPGAAARPPGGQQGGCAPRDPRVAAPYPISGYWVSPDADACRTRRTVEAMHRIGADTIVVMGQRLLPGTGAAGCVVDGQPCDRLAGVRRVFGYEAREDMGDALLRCPGVDRNVPGGFQLLFVPCEGTQRDLIIVRVADDGVGHLLREAAAFGMKVFPGLPTAPAQEGRPWLPDLSAMAPLKALTERVAARYRGRAEVAGVYQAFEMSMRERLRDDPVLALYRDQHRSVARALPGGTILVSPYFHAHTDRGFPPAKVAAGLAQLGATRAGSPMAVAVQDGRGTGKVGVFGGDQVEEPVEPGLVPAVGQVRNGQAYQGSTGDYFAAAARRPVEGVELWMNVEVFEPAPEAGLCSRPDGPQRGRAAKERVDRQLAAAAGRVGKVLSYAWDPYLICTESGRPPLAAEIEARWAEPIVFGAERSGSGVALRGHRLEGAELTFSYRTTSGTTASVPVRGGAVVPFEPVGLDPAQPWVRAGTARVWHTFRWE
ncbi:hypothetical protein [Nonomuraea sp. NPDC050310]|uniref:hypothetical protein n=1 Tax=Nonomuraea sp. NPDC050310 TaxID=3154935 RepID=UPI0034118905